MLNRRASDRATAPADLAAVRQASPLDADLEFGLPQDRAARIAARRAFVEMKQLFIRAAEHLENGKAAWLRGQVRAAEAPTDLWVLRNALITALRLQDERTRALRAELYRSLDSIAPERLSESLGGPDRLPPLPGNWNAWTRPMPARPDSPARR